MECQRCGYCCVEYMVVIIHPDYITEELDINSLPEDALICKPSGEVCQHLTIIADNISVCKIHHFEWYKETPCYSHTQIEHCNSPCRIGEGIKSGRIPWTIK